VAWNDVPVPPGVASISLTSAAFAHGGTMPRRHAGYGVGDDVSPPLAWADVPPGTIECALIVEDPSAPVPRPFVHAVAYAIAPGVTSLPEGALSPPIAAAAHDGYAVGKNSLGRRVYMGPRPVPGHGPHVYAFQLFALDRALSFAKPPSRKALVQAMAGAVIGRGRLDGIYER